MSVSSVTYADAKTLIITKYGEEFLNLRKATDEEYEQNGQLYTHVFENPAGYYPSPDNLEVILNTFTSFIGEEVVEYDIKARMEDPVEKEKLMELFRQYSLMDKDGKWAFELKYSYPEFDTILYISERLGVVEEGMEESEATEFVYYIYSPDFDIIAEFREDDLPWVQWDLLTFMDDKPLAVSIDNVSKIEVDYDDTKATFTLLGTGNDLKVTSSNGVAVDTNNFRQFYLALLYPSIDGYAEMKEEYPSLLRLTVTLRDGTTTKYEFFGMTASKSFYTTNGEGKFYINRDYVKQIVRASNGILAGETITVERTN